MAKECKKEIVVRKKRKASKTLESGFLRREAVKEAGRCLSLRECEACDACELLCPDLCITRHKKTGEVFIDLNYCKGCGICAFICPKGAIQMILEDEI
jgi:Pyruvate/2-oxoacid:ferredoxin oxidoreductase delta subunit